MSIASVDVGWLEWLAETAQAKVEVDLEGSIIVTRATDAHSVAASELLQQLARARPADLLLMIEGPRWAPLGGEGPSYVPDLAIVERRALQRANDDFALDPAPLLVVEVVSPESRRRDLQEKAAAYYTGGAQAYWTVEVPRLSPVEVPELTVRRRGPRGWETGEPVRGVVEIDAPFPVGLDLSRLAL